MKSFLAFLRQHLLPTLVCFGLAGLLARTEWMQRIENLSLDFRTRWRVARQAVADPRLVVVGIDDDSLARFGRWPWSRRVHGQFLYSVAQAKPAVIGWDILFTEPTDDDAALVAGAKELPGRVIFAAFASEETAEAGTDAAVADLSRPFSRVEGDIDKIYSSASALLPVPALRGVALTAFVDTPAGADGVRRVAPLLVRIKDKVYPSLSLQTLLRFWDVADDAVTIRPGDAIYIDAGQIKRRIPIDETGGYLVNYRYSMAGFNVLSHAALTINFTKRFVKKEAIEVPDVAGKILLIGQMSTGLSDNGPTPFSPETPLVLVHANVLNNILLEDYARHAPIWPVWIGALVFGAGGLVIFSARKFHEQVMFSAGLPVLFLAAAIFAWSGASVWIPVVWPLTGFGLLQAFMIARRLIAEQRAKEQIKGMFGTYVSPALVNRMVESGESPRLGGHEDEITPYFSDIQGFSTFSEKLPPDRLVELMNEYLTACTDIVQEEGGTLDKYIGDAVVAMFGAPIALPDHAFRACVASQRVQQKLGELREKWKAEGDKWPAIVWRMQSRIGLNSGNCIIGNMGSRTRFNYTMMGDNVNLAARMESGAKSWGVYTMCAEATKLACEQHGGDRVVFRALGRIVVMGRSQAVPIYEIVGLKENVAASTHECLGLFAAGLAKYYERDWDGALAAFAQSLPLEMNGTGSSGGSNPSVIYMRIAQHLKEEPPADNWDGSYVMKEK